MPLTEENIRQRLVEVERRFNDAKVRHDQLEAQAQAAEEEKIKIQGEYRALQALLDDLTKEDDSKPEKPSKEEAKNGQK